ncbi:TfuA-like protein [Streptomyces syringium]|uniref:TfuA-like protein n=1 Tax=Streptomyces syringium TaxID=76729 RepID=UPI0037D95634
MIHVFTGPTLSPDDPALSDSRFVPRPPAAHGDLFDAGIATSDTVVIIDGCYHHTPALRHKEILAAMGRGVRVVGAASIGALRAAELAPYGMVGVGEIYHAYASGVIEGDDEVAVGQSAGDDLRSVTWPLINVRHVLTKATEAQVIDTATASRVLHELRGVYYPHRSLTAVLALSRRCGTEKFGPWLTTGLKGDRHFGDLKRADALQALDAALALDATPAPPPLPKSLWDTRCYRQWSNAFAAQTVDGVRLPTSHRLAYQQIFDPQFKRLWWDYVNTSAGTTTLPYRLACAVIRPATDLRDQGTVSRLLAHETPADRAAITRYAALNTTAARAQRGFFPGAIKDSVARQVLAAAWSTRPDALGEEAWARGFQGVPEAVAAAKHFVLGFVHDQQQKEEVR